MNLRMNDDTTSEPDDATITELFASDDVEDDLVLQFPSPDFPAPPAFRLRVPASWRAVPVPEAEMALRDPVAVDGFHANVVVRVRRTAASETVTDDLFRAIAVGEADDGHEVLSEEVRADLDTPARWLLVRFRGPDGRIAARPPPPHLRAGRRACGQHRDRRGDDPGLGGGRARPPDRPDRGLPAAGAVTNPFD